MTKKKTVRLVMSQELYDLIRTRAQEEMRTVPKHILQIIKQELGLMGAFNIIRPQTITHRSLGRPQAAPTYDRRRGYST